MKIYESHNAPNPRRVRIFLAEKGIQVPTRRFAERIAEIRCETILGGSR